MLCPRPWLGAVVGLEKPSVFTSPPPPSLRVISLIRLWAQGDGPWTTRNRAPRLEEGVLVHFSFWHGDYLKAGEGE